MHLCVCVCVRVCVQLNIHRQTYTALDVGIDLHCHCSMEHDKLYVRMYVRMHACVLQHVCVRVVRFEVHSYRWFWSVGVDSRDV